MNKKQQNSLSGVRINKFNTVTDALSNRGFHFQKKRNEKPDTAPTAVLSNTLRYSLLSNPASPKQVSSFSVRGDCPRQLMMSANLNIQDQPVPMFGT